MPPVTFSDEAPRTDDALPLAGQCPPAQNVVEQTALFDAGREVTADDIEQYLLDRRTRLHPGACIGLFPHLRPRAGGDLQHDLPYAEGDRRAPCRDREAPRARTADSHSGLGGKGEMPMSLVHYHHPAAHTSTVEDITADDITAATAPARHRSPRSRLRIPSAKPYGARSKTTEADARPPHASSTSRSARSIAKSRNTDWSDPLAHRSTMAILAHASASARALW